MTKGKGQEKPQRTDFWDDPDAPLAGLFSDPRHVIAFADGEVRQPVNACFLARVIGGTLTTTSEAAEVAWVPADRLDEYEIHPAIRRRITHGLAGRAAPQVD